MARSTNPNPVRKSRASRWFRSSLGGLVVVLLALAAYSEWLGFQAARDYPPRGTFAKVAGATLHYHELKPQQASKGTIVLVHGAWAGHADLLAALGPYLRDYRVIAIDRPGQGWSDRPGDWDMADPGSQAEMLMGLLDRIAPERLVLVAHSLGGPLAAHIALDRPQRLHGLVLLSAITHPWLGNAVHYLPLPTSPRLGPIFNRLIGIPLASFLLPNGVTLAFSPQAVPPDYIKESELPLLYREKTFRSNLQDIVAADDFLKSQTLRYRQMRVPILAITGDRDTFVSPKRHSLALVHEAPMAQLMILPGVGHMPHHAEPKMVAKTITDLIGQP